MLVLLDQVVLLVLLEPQVLVDLKEKRENLVHEENL